IDAWFISGDLGLRKPSPAIYRHALERLGVTPAEVTFVDDRPRNLDAARALGIGTVLLDVKGEQTNATHRIIRELAELLCNTGLTAGRGRTRRTARCGREWHRTASGAGSAHPCARRTALHWGRREWSCGAHRTHEQAMPPSRRATGRHPGR